MRKDWEVLNSLLLIDCQAGQHEGLQSLVWSRQPDSPESLFDKAADQTEGDAFIKVGVADNRS